MIEHVLEGGFADPVMHAQGAFRAVLDALASPGTRQTLVSPVANGSRLSPQLASVLLTLTDTDTPIWLTRSLGDDPAVHAFLSFHTGAPVMTDAERAAFACADAADALPPLSHFNLGTQEYPDRSTTLVLQVPALEGGPILTLRGPGIREHRHIAPQGLPADFVAQWGQNRELFPRGIDLLLVADGEVMGLPRTTRIGEGH